MSPGHTPFDDFGPVPFPLSNATPFAFIDTEGQLVSHFLFRALYRLDSVLTPVPDLASQLCDASADGLVVTCGISPATFSNGDDLTAEDVVFTYDLARAEWCPWQGTVCLKEVLADVKEVDATTVRFTLKEKDPTFITQVLPTIFIDSKDLVERQFAALLRGAGKVGSAALRAEGERLDALLQGDKPACTGEATVAEGLIATAGIELPDRRMFLTGPENALDECDWLAQLTGTLFQAADALDGTGTEAVAAGYGILPLNWRPVGTGAWRVDETRSEPGQRLVLTASATSELSAATPEIEFLIYPSRRDAAEALRSGEVDWLRLAWDERPDLVHLVETYPGMVMARYAVPTDVTRIELNMRPGRLFADPDLRRALALCIDRRALVEAGTDGMGLAAAGMIPSNTWAADPGLVIPARDVEEGKRLIEGSGWTLQDGVYRKGGEPLSADIIVREEYPVRVKLARLVALQAADCGMDLRAKLMDGLTLFDDKHGLIRWPHLVPGTKEPFDMFLVTRVGTADPADGLSDFETQSLSSKAEPFGSNVYGFSNTRYDTLATQARDAYDTVQRARAYREMQQILADGLPAVPLYYSVGRDALGAGLTSTAGPLDLATSGWDWQPERLVIEAPPP